MRSPILPIYRLLPVLFGCIYLLPSCSKKRCRAPETILFALYNYDSTNGDTAAVVAAYAPGNTFAVLKNTTIATIYQQGTDGLIGCAISNNNFFDYIITLKPSNMEHRISNRKYETDYSNGSFGHTERCVIKFSCLLDGRPYSQQQAGFNQDTSRDFNYLYIN